MKKVLKNLVAAGMVTGIVVSNCLMVFGADDSGNTTGWRQNQTGWYYQDNSGFIQNQWKEINGAWYYFNQDGYMLTGWQNLGGVWYYLGSSGAMHTGWLQLGDAWYYMDGNGAMVTGDRWIDGKDYYFNADGSMDEEETDASEWKEAYRQYLIENKSKYSSDNSFGLIDMDGDGIDELFICFNNCWISESLTYQNGQVKQIEWEDAESEILVGPSTWFEDGTIGTGRLYGSHGEKVLHRYENGKFIKVIYLDYDTDDIGDNFERDYRINSKRCTEEEWDELYDLYFENGLDWQNFMYSYTNSNINSILGD